MMARECRRRYGAFVIQMVGSSFLLWAFASGAFLFSGCSAPAPTPALAANPAYSLGLGTKSGACVAGRNVVPAMAFLSRAGQKVRDLEPADGEFKLVLIGADQAESPITLRWLKAPDESVASSLRAGPPWNLEFQFESPTAGACPIRIEFQPSPRGKSAGLSPAVTTMVMMEPPPPPPHASD